MTTSPFENTSNPSGQGFPPPTNPSRARSYVRPIVLLVLMGVIGVLLFEGLLGFPGLFFWFIGGDLMKPLTTDLTAGDFIQLGWVRFRAGGGGAVHCRLGGDPDYVDGKAVLVSNEDNRGVISMFLGSSAPQAPCG